MSGIFPSNSTWTIPCNVNIRNTSGSAGYPNLAGSFGVTAYANITSIIITSNSSGNITNINAVLDIGSSWSQIGLNPSGSFTYLRRINNSGTTITNTNGFVGTFPNTDLSSTISSTFFIQYQGTSSRRIDGYSTDATATTLNYNILVPNLSNNMIFVDTSTYSKVLLLGSPSLAVSGSLIYIKDKSGSAASNNIIVVASGADTIDGRALFTINNNWGCLTLYSTGTTWRVANYYPSTDQPILTQANSWPPSPPAIRTADAEINSINVFDQAKSAQRNVAATHNIIKLPVQTGSVGSMCIIVYAGTNLNSSVLFVTNKGSGKLDGVINTDTNQPYLFTENGTTKSPGAVFIGDGTDWYVVGWYYGSNWSWTRSPGFWGMNATNPMIAEKGTTTTGTGQNRYWILPYPALSAAPNFRFVIFKCIGGMPSGTDGDGIMTYPYTDGNTISPNNYFNPPVAPGASSITSLIYSGNQTRMCLWLVSLKLGSNNYISTYPIIGYTPGA